MGVATRSSTGAAVPIPVGTRSPPAGGTGDAGVPDRPAGADRRLRRGPGRGRRSGPRAGRPRAVAVPFRVEGACGAPSSSCRSRSRCPRVPKSDWPGSPNWPGPRSSTPRPRPRSPRPGADRCHRGSRSPTDRAGLHDAAQEGLASLGLGPGGHQAAPTGSKRAGRAARGGGHRGEWRAGGTGARSPVASIRLSWPRAGCARRCGRWPAARPSRSGWTSRWPGAARAGRARRLYAVSEALTNTAKHARASSAEVEVTAREGPYKCASGTRPRRRGLRPRFGPDRAEGPMEAIGGPITLRSPPGAGTDVGITLPLGRPASPVSGS